MFKIPEPGFVLQHQVAQTFKSSAHQKQKYRFQLLSIGGALQRSTLSCHISRYHVAQTLPDICDASMPLQTEKLQTAINQQLYLDTGSSKPLVVFQLLSLPHRLAGGEDSFLACSSMLVAVVCRRQTILAGMQRDPSFWWKTRKALGLMPGASRAR